MARTHVRLLRSVHVAPGVFDLEARLRDLPEGEAFKWVGWAGRLGDNGRLRAPLAWARDHGLALSAFLMGPKGLASRAMQSAWGGAFTYAAPDDGPAAAPGTAAALDPAGLAQREAPSGPRPLRRHRGPGAAFPGSGLPQSPLPAGLQGPALPAPGLRRAAEAVEALDTLDLLGLEHHGAAEARRFRKHSD